MLWYEMEYNRLEMGVNDKLESEPEIFNYNEEEEVINELNKSDLRMVSLH